MRRIGVANAFPCAGLVVGTIAALALDVVPGLSLSRWPMPTIPLESRDPDVRTIRRR